MDIFQCVPNVSASDPELLEEMAGACGEFARVHDYSCDSDHNRSVITMTGTAEELLPALVQLARLCLEHIDLNSHKGVHPRIGALDVVPVVPLFGASMESAAELSYNIGEAVSSLGIPVYFYEESAHNRAYRYLENIRRGGFEWLRDHPGERPPDLGEGLHPTAGACVIGAREPLVAFNVNLDTRDTEIAKTIASEIRSRRKKKDKRFEGVKALGLFLRSSGTVQVSTNITRPHKTGVFPVYDYIRQRAEELGCSVRGSELIGVIAEDISTGIVKDALKLEDFDPARIIRKADDPD
ncbi:MAG: glutamate formimidoyltransferase [Abditibacteriota bacterium]|nr:glutamate formimidoyltransferase [Abditibacteriota bacterium]